MLSHAGRRVRRVPVIVPEDKASGANFAVNYFPKKRETFF
jgi:hypothetical protein